MTRTQPKSETTGRLRFSQRASLSGLDSRPGQRELKRFRISPLTLLMRPLLEILIQFCSIVTVLPPRLLPPCLPPPGQTWSHNNQSVLYSWSPPLMSNDYHCGFLLPARLIMGRRRWPAPTLGALLKDPFQQTWPQGR